MIKKVFMNLKNIRYFLKSFYLKNEQAFNGQEIISISQSYEKISQNKLVKTYYEEFNKYFGSNLENFFFIDQRDLFNRYIYLCRYRKFFKLIYEGKIKSARSGYPYLSELIAIASRKSKSFIFMPYRLFNNFKYFLSFLTKIILNIISLIKLIFIRIFIKNQSFIVIRTSNNFYKGKKFDYRISYLVEELDRQKKKTCFFIRSRHGPVKLISHYFRRDRISFYTDNIIHFLFFISELRLKISSIKNYPKKLYNPSFDYYLLDVIFAKHLIRVKSINYSKKILGVLFKLLKTKFYVGDNCERSIMEFLSAKENKVKTIYFQNGTEFDFYMINKFINNPKVADLNFLAHDKLYAWNDYWKNYYISKGKVYSDKNIIAKGYFRYFLKKDSILNKAKINPDLKDKLPILFLIENETPVCEIIDYLIKIVQNGYQVVFKLRPQQKDAGDYTYEMIIDQLSSFIKYENQISKTDLSFEKIDMSLYKLAIGSYTTALMDCLINNLDILVLYTPSWEDCFALEKNPLVNKLFCKKPDILLNRIKNFDKLDKAQKEIRKVMLPISNQNFLEDIVSEMY